MNFLQLYAHITNISDTMTDLEAYFSCYYSLIKLSLFTVVRTLLTLTYWYYFLISLGVFTSLPRIKAGI